MTTRNNEPGIARRPFLRGAGVTLATLGGMTGSVVAEGHGNGSDSREVSHLADTPADFAIYWSSVSDEANDPNEPGDFGFPEGSLVATGGPFLGGTDPGDGEGLFDGSNIKISPSYRTLHHSFQLFAGMVMKGKPKSYTLVNQGDGRFESRGQTVNFEARSRSSIEAYLTHALAALGHPAPAVYAGQLASNPPFRTLAGGTWRAVASEQLKVDLTGDQPFDSEWAATRVDIYSRGRDGVEYALSLLYTLWSSGDLMSRGSAMKHAGSLIAAGRSNPGGR